MSRPMDLIRSMEAILAQSSAGTSCHLPIKDYAILIRLAEGKIIETRPQDTEAIVSWPMLYELVEKAKTEVSFYIARKLAA